MTNLPWELDVRAALAQFAADVQRGHVESLGNAGGFSGARFWRLSTPAGRLCLRRWPREHPTRDRLAFIHDVLRHVRQHGFDKVPVPLDTTDGKSFVETGGHLWELTPWLDGTADYSQRPSRERLCAALEALAQFHQAAATFPVRMPNVGPSPALAERLQLLRGLRSGGLNQIERAVHPGDWPELEPRAHRLLVLFRSCCEPIGRQLETAASLESDLQPCLRDIWHDHVLFQGDEVSGFVDFGAMRVESVAGDIARLMCSLIEPGKSGADKQGWQDGLDAYESVRPLSANERKLIDVFHRSGMLLSGMNWLRWIYLQRRTFESRDRILRRLDEFIGRLEQRPTVDL